MGALLGLVALVLSLIAISRLNRLQREIESLRKQWLLDSLGSPRRGSPEEAGRLPVARRVPAREQPVPVLSRPPDFEKVEPPKSPSPPVGASVPPDTAAEEIPFEVASTLAASLPRAKSRPELSLPSPSHPGEERGSFAATAPAGATEAPSELHPHRDMGSLEAAIGGSWLNRIGIALLVIGIASALGYSMTVMGPAGKSAVATAVSLFLIVAGVILERREAYRFYGRGLIGGGWAALYATAYAVHELEATRLVTDPRIGFALLLVVGVGMILHSLRYANQGLTALAYSLAYAAIVLHNISAYTLAAGTLLGLGTILHLATRRWYALAWGGIAATYGSLFLWYSHQKTMTAGTLRLGLTALAIDWVVFLAADFSREPSDAVDRTSARSVGLLNAFCVALLSFLAWSRFQPGGGWQPFLVLGFLYVCTSTALRRLGRSAVHPIHSLAASVFLAAAAGLGLRRERTAWAWLAQAQGLVLIGVWLKDRFHRLLGCTFFVAPAGLVAALLLSTRLQRPDGRFDGSLILLSAVSCACFYFTRWRLMSTGDEEERAGIGFPRWFFHAAFAAILLTFWVQLPEVYVAAAGALLAVVLFEWSAIGPRRDLRIQSYLSAFYALLAVAVFSLPSKVMLLGHAARIPASLAVAACYLAIFLRLGKGKHLTEEEAILRPAFPWVASGLVALLVWLEARPILVGPAWMILALLLVELGIALRETHLRRPGYVLVVASCVSLLMSNLTAGDQVLGWPVRVVTLVPAIAAIYYLWWRLRSLPESGRADLGDLFDERYGRLLSYLGGILAGLFFRFQFGLEGVALRWSVTMVVLLVVGYLLRDADLRFQAYLLAGAVLIRAVGFDFQQAPSILGMEGPLAIVVVAAACFLAAGTIVRRRVASAAGHPRAPRRVLALESRLEQIGQDLMWLFAVALVAVYFYRTQSGSLLIVAWALEGLCVTGAGFALKSRALRLSGLALLGLGLVMTLYRAFRYSDTIGRIVTFLVLGVVLLLISFGYARYRDALKKAP